jgi:hypothetical protein
LKQIISLEVKDSSFFSTPLSIKFSDKLNCIMGSRGTGKSTLLHFIKACLEENAEEDKATYNVLVNNLGSGTIILKIKGADGKTYKIEKTIEEYPQCYDSKGNFIELEKIYDLISCDIYEAQEIEDIGRNSGSRLDLIDKMITEQLEEYEEEIAGIQGELDENAQSIISENRKLQKLLNAEKSFVGAEDELNKWLKEKPKDIDQKEEKQFAEADKIEKVRAGEKRYVTQLIKKLNELQSTFQEMIEEVASMSQPTSSKVAFHNKDILDKISAESQSIVKSVSQALDAQLKALENAIKKIDFLNSQLTEKHSKQQNEFTKLKQRIEKHKEYYTKWTNLSKKVDEHKDCLKQIDTLKQKLSKIFTKRKALIDKLNKAKKGILNLRLSKIAELNSELKGSIKITLKAGGITDDYEQLLKNALKGSNMRYNAIIPAITQNFPPDKLASIIRSRDAETLKRISGIDKERADALIAALSLSEDIFEIEKLYCPDLPDFHLRIDIRDGKGNVSRNDYRKTEELSTGQRCTAVLPIAFSVSQNPLIIDQPEDNLDNKYISDSIREIITSQREKRQLIFITHNPNIPVLSDAEFNVFLSYSDKKSKIDVHGSVDDVKYHILNLLEGGEKAFSRRDELYNLDKRAK